MSSTLYTHSLYNINTSSIVYIICFYLDFIQPTLSEISHETFSSENYENGFITTSFVPSSECCIVPSSESSFVRSSESSINTSSTAVLDPTPSPPPRSKNII